MLGLVREEWKWEWRVGRKENGLLFSNMSLFFPVAPDFYVLTTEEKPVK